MRSPLAVGGAAHGWRNDGDRNPNTHHGRSLTSALVNADAVAALEVSSALRGHGLSLDGALTRVGSRALDAAFAGGLYEHGEAHLQAVSVEGGYMIARRVEALGSFDALDSRTFAAL